MGQVSPPVTDTQIFTQVNYISIHKFDFLMVKYNVRKIPNIVSHDFFLSSIYLCVYACLGLTWP